MTLHVSEEYVNATEGHRFGNSEVYDTGRETAGEVYRAMRREYGRCVSKVYVDTPKGSRAVGWVFLSRQQYEDARDNRESAFYLREVWVTLHDAPDTVTTESHFHFMED